MKRKNHVAVQIAFFAVTVGLLAFLSAKQSFNPFANFFSNTSSAVTSFLFNLFTWNSETRSLEEENRLLLLRLADMDLLRQENLVLREALRLSDEKQRRLLPVESGGFFRAFGNEILVVNRGKEAGIRRGDIVVAEGNVYVGRVLGVGEKSAEVILASSLSQAVEVDLIGLGVRGGALGRSGGEFEIRFIPSDVPVEEGGFFAVSSDPSNKASGLVLGRILEVKNRPGEIFQGIRGTHLFNPLVYAPLFVLLSDEI